MSCNDDILFYKSRRLGCCSGLLSKMLKNERSLWSFFRFNIEVRDQCTCFFVDKLSKNWACLKLGARIYFTSKMNNISSTLLRELSRNYIGLIWISHWFILYRNDRRKLFKFFTAVLSMLALNFRIMMQSYVNLWKTIILKKGIKQLYYFEILSVCH